MSIQQEEILLKEFTSGTTLTYFSTHLNAITDVLSRNPNINYVPTVVWLDNFNNPVKVSTFDGKNLWTLNTDNIYVPLEDLSSNHITGYSYVKDFAYIVDDNRLALIKERFNNQVSESLTTGATILTAEGVAPNPNAPVVPGHTDYVFRDFHEIDDFFVNIKLNRTYGTLDTLNIYNNLVNSIPTQEANTGVVFGRLVALQNIKDSEGNNIRIPLRNVPVGIFNSSQDYPNSSSVSDNGDRIFLNIKESISQSEYFNVESFDFDKNKLLRSASQFTTVPDQYKYVTTTNDEGEFVIYDAPIGTQIVMFEVDLLKQGLTRDEIALNFFPFPPDDDAILDQIPNFAFKQFPIDVVPAWGTIQTGFTELNVTVNMDLRKWTTYIFPPMAIGAQRLESAVAQNAANSIKIEMRNMAKQDFPKTEIKFAEIQTDLDRVFGQQYNWHLEFAQIKNKAEFYKFGCPVIKLPANIYDPNGFKTDPNGVPTSHKGVWLSAYQLNVFSNNKVNRKTGSIYAWNGSDMFTKSHFDLNYSPAVPDSSPTPSFGEGLGSFPYEKPWTIDYPDQYKIPQKPTDQRYQYEPDRTPSSSPGIYYLDEPAYNDGDLVGYEVFDPNNSPTGGFGSQSGFGIWFGNRISQVATRNFMYKYEAGVAWNEEYANGYQPSNPGYLRFAGVSKVVNGEKYQRFEAGYGYFLKPSGWPRIMRTLWGADTYFGPDITYGVGLGGNTESPGPGTTTSIVSGGIWGSETHANDVYNLNNIDLALVMDNNASIKKGTLEAYRIVNSNPDNLNEPQIFVLPTYVRLACDASAERLYSFVLKNTGEVTVSFPMLLYGGVSTPSGLVGPGGTITLAPGQSYTLSNPVDGGLFPPEFALAYTNQILPGNKNFNVATNRYDTASYQLRFAIDGPNHYGDTYYVQFDKTAKTTPDQWYMKTNHSGGSNGKISNGINTLNGGDPSAEIWHIEIQNNNSSYDL
jgi:hypothetical protein